MKLIGKVTKYNGKFGTIVTQDDDIVDFDFDDISFNQNINIDDVVEFRLETRIPNIKIARNIRLVSDGETK